MDKYRKLSKALRESDDSGSLHNTRTKENREIKNIIENILNSHHRTATVAYLITRTNYQGSRSQFIKEVEAMGYTYHCEIVAGMKFDTFSKV